MERKHITADVGVIIGRFQVDELHPGHLDLLTWVGKQHKIVVIVLGVPAVSCLSQNPLNYSTRLQMLQKEYPNYIIVPLKDCRDNETWSRNLDKIINDTISPMHSVILYGARESFLEYYKGKYATQELVGDDILWSGSTVRQNIRTQNIYSKDFRTGVIWASQNRYKMTVPTVDIAIFRNDTILLARKDGEKLWRFIGGFVEPTSNSYEEDAIREVLEETGLVVRDVQYIGSFLVNDWRYKHEDKIKTILFATQCYVGEAIASDDIKECRWWKTNIVTEDMLVEEHRKLWRTLCQHYGI